MIEPERSVEKSMRQAGGLIPPPMPSGVEHLPKLEKAKADVSDSPSDAFGR